MNLFYHPSIEFAKLNINDEFELPADEAMHAIKVLRLSLGANLWLTDGKGYKVQTEIVEISKKNVVVRLLQKELFLQKSFRIVLAVAPTKNPSRFEWFLEKATEMGVDEIYPIVCDHSEKRNFNSERTNRVITSAMKQSLKFYHPILHDLTSLDLILKMDFDGEKFMAHYENEHQISLKDAFKKSTNVLIIIGPEGDFSKEEIQLSKKLNIQTVLLGDSRLRTETAALVACFTINLMNQ